MYAALDPRTAIADALPPQTSFLTRPISNSVKNFMQQRINAILQTPQFQQIWLATNRNAHAQLVGMLHDHSNVVVTSNSQVVLNLIPLLNSVLKELQQPASQLVSRNMTLPQLSGNELPSVACERIASTLNQPLPPTCGQIVLFPADKLDNARRAVTTFDRTVIGLLIVTPLLTIITVALSHRRRRTLIQLLVAGSLALVIVHQTMFWLQDQLVAQDVPENKDTHQAIVHDVLRNFFNLTL